MKWISSIVLALAMTFPGRAFSYEKPILLDSSPATLSVSAPEEQRDPKFADLLSVSLKINVSGASGSGTICHYDKSSGFAHVISCGHLWSGNMEYKPGRTPVQTARVTVWYKNSRKLETPESFPAEVLFWSNDRGFDVSLLKFKPDWEPKFVHIDEHSRLTPGMSLNSMGCDGGREVARYEVVFERWSSVDIITVKNSPRPGRSGGGLIDDRGSFVGVCWGTSDVSSGRGIGYFTPVSSIRKVFDRNDHGWLLEVLEFEYMPIVDWDQPGRTYGKDFIPIPAGNQ